MIDLNNKHSSVHVKHGCNVYNKKWAEKGVPKRVGRKHNWAEKDWAENKSGPKSDLPKFKYLRMGFPQRPLLWLALRHSKFLYL